MKQTPSSGDALGGELAGLVGDIGGTHARFALAMSDGTLRDVGSIPTANHAGLASAIEDYLSTIGRPRLSRAVLAVASPLSAERVLMTNHPWAFSVAELRGALGLESLVVINDFVAQALALPLLGDADCVATGEQLPGVPHPRRSLEGVVAVTGPGTGLGVAGLIALGGPGPRRYLPLYSQGGHASYAPMDWPEARVVAYARHRFEHVSAERLISGAGLELIHRALHEEAATAVEIARRAQAGDSAAHESMNCLFGMLGSFAGSLALTLGARAGVYIAGGIVPANLPLFLRSPFRDRFEAKGRYREWLAAVPTYVVTASDAGLRGAADLVRRLASPQSAGLAEAIPGSFIAAHAAA